jgi:hypothetical protein
VHASRFLEIGVLMVELDVRDGGNSASARGDLGHERSLGLVAFWPPGWSERLNSVLRRSSSSPALWCRSAVQVLGMT